MQDEIINAVLARGIHADACRQHVLVAWAVMRDQLDYPGKVVARLYHATSTPFVLLADTLAEIHAVLPPRLIRSDRQPSDPLEVVEIWFPGVAERKKTGPADKRGRTGAGSQY